MPHLSPLARFSLVAGLGYLLWFAGYEHYLAADGRLDALLTRNLATVSAAGLRAAGYAARVSAGGTRPLLYLQAQPVVYVGHPCNGLVLYALFAGFVAAYPGAAIRKLWFLPLGLSVLYGVNVLRIMALALNHYYAHRSVEFNHHYTFTLVEYAVIFGLWVWWATRLALPAPSSPYAAG